ncbi:MAG TPA: Gfo/Idh/MocA family oxidoreductase [Fimbriiglobus sp.]|nr:Gfo/Idh/MocA family oxidoreductase [Fimbriiglobus sp.]
MTHRITRRTALKGVAASVAAPFVYRAHAHAAPSETVLHVSVGANGMARSDIQSLTRNKHCKLVAVADVDEQRSGWIKKAFPGCQIFTDWREMFDKVKFDSANVSVPDHMHAAPTMRAIRSGKNVYTQKPLTQTLYEARQLTRAAREKKVVSQMGIQIHSSREHRAVVALIHDGAIGKVKEAHSWSGKQWGDPAPRPDRSDPVPANLSWDLWLGVAAARPFLGGGYYHPGNWRKRLDFGTGTYGDMGCHILDPVFGAMGLTAPTAVLSAGDAPNKFNWPLNCEVAYTFPGSKYTTDTATVTWYNGDRRPPAAVSKLIAPHKFPLQGSVYIGTDGVLFSPYIGMPVLLPAEKFRGHKAPDVGSADHYGQFVEACRGNGATSAPFDYSGPLTEMVLLGCLATRFPKTKLEWDAANLKVTNVAEANEVVRRKYREGWEEAGL